MPRGQPFTQLCQQFAAVSRGAVADLHTHTTASDGDYTPSQLVAAARQEGLAAVAVTDHDTLAGVGEAVAAAKAFTHRPVAVVPGVEVTAEHAGREYHLLGHFVRPDHPGLAAALESVRGRRAERFHRFLDLLAGQGVVIPPHLTAAAVAVSPSLGRRHVATLLVRAGLAATRFAAFRRFLDPIRDRVGINHRLPIAEAIRLIVSAGGVAGLAHPPEGLDGAILAEFAGYGLNAVEAVFPAATAGRTGELRAWADRLGLVVTGGSDFHGPDGRRPGAPGLSAAEYRRFLEFAGRSAPAGAAGGGGRPG